MARKRHFAATAGRHETYGTCVLCCLHRAFFVAGCDCLVRGMTEVMTRLSHGSHEHTRNQLHQVNIMATPAWDAGGNIINLTRKEKLMQRAKENGEIFEKILHQHPGLERETVEAIVYDANDPEFGDVKPLKAENCPKFKHSSGRTGARILVIHGDTIVGQYVLLAHCGNHLQYISSHCVCA
ncbi:hypothetical protein BU23DRAFT_133411 [Bimuria novae-zelandiae CBS 107.79]|uniref:Uncharacterized protein n=1 Tax=Bimuria novae-zelandiae CBS 107.79 TaxID=1447943 RepID=A0A6A5V883_9PLEO|nr:hypothetical protein BU23DRAFT_133411 [Bimuria novae-zelandiae CBS 107.79]